MGVGVVGRQLWRTLFGRFAPDARAYGTDECMAALAAAVRLAERKGHPFVCVEHVVAGLLSVPESEACGVLASLGVDPGRIAGEMGHWVERGDVGAPRAELPAYTSRARRVLEAGLREARAADREHVGSDLVLLAAAEDSTGVTANLLARHGVTAERLRAALAERTRDGTACRAPAAAD